MLFLSTNITRLVQSKNVENVHIFDEQVHTYQIYFCTRISSKSPLSLSSFALKKKIVNQPFCCNLWYEKLYKKQRTLGMIMWKKVSFRETIIDLKSIFFIYLFKWSSHETCRKRMWKNFSKNRLLFAYFSTFFTSFSPLCKQILQLQQLSRLYINNI